MYLLEDGVRVFFGDLFDLHAAGGGGHEDELSEGAIEDDAEVQFAVNRECFFDQELLDNAAFGAGLVGDEGHAEHLFGNLRGLFGRSWRF